MLQVWQIWLHCHGLSMQDTSFWNPSDSSQTSQKLSCQIKFKTPPWRERWTKPLEIPFSFWRHCSLSHHNSYRGCSRSQQGDKCSHHRSSSWWSCSTYRGYNHQLHHNTPHWPHCRSSIHRSSSAYQSRDCSRSCSWPSYQSSRQDSHRSSSYSSRSNGKSHLKKNLRMKIKDPHMDYYSSDGHSSDSGEESDHLN